MKLDCVTITGADDKTDPKDLVRLSSEFPFVEWGILFSHRQEGTYRFPSRAWVDALIEEYNLHADMRLSAHLCGRWVRELMVGTLPIGSPEMPKALTDRFRRLQINFHAEDHAIDLPAFVGTMRAIYARPQIIFQLDGVNDAIALQAQEAGLHVAGLFDASGGAGITPKTWPLPISGLYCGYAGGLGPDNIQEQLDFMSRKVVPSYRHIWIDMERNVRTPDDSQLDLEKVRFCLQAARPYVTEGRADG